MGNPVGSEQPGKLVECRSDYQYAQRPVALYWQGERLEVVKLEGEWRTPGGQRFKVRVGDGRVFTLEYDEAEDGWQVNPI